MKSETCFTHWNGEHKIVQNQQKKQSKKLLKIYYSWKEWNTLLKDDNVLKIISNKFTILQDKGGQENESKGGESKR